MASKEEIEKTILEVAGNPESGAIREWAPVFAEAIAALDNPPSQPAKEKRVLSAQEVR